MISLDFNNVRFLLFKISERKNYIGKIQLHTVLINYIDIYFLTIQQVLLLKTDQKQKKSRNCVVCIDIIYCAIAALVHKRSNVIFACHIIIYNIILFSLPSPQLRSLFVFVNIIIIVHNADRYYDALLVYVSEFFGCPRVETFLRPGVTGFPYICILYIYMYNIVICIDSGPKRKLSPRTLHIVQKVVIGALLSHIYDGITQCRLNIFFLLPGFTPKIKSCTLFERFLMKPYI